MMDPFIDSNFSSNDQEPDPLVTFTNTCHVQEVRVEGHFSSVTHIDKLRYTVVIVESSPLWSFRVVNMFICFSLKNC